MNIGDSPVIKYSCDYCIRIAIIYYIIEFNYNYIRISPTLRLKMASCHYLMTPLLGTVGLPPACTAAASDASSSPFLTFNRRSTHHAAYFTSGGL